MWQQLQHEHVPLIFAGVDYLFPMYKEANTYQNLADEPITGNPDRISESSLHQAALAIVRRAAKRKNSRCSTNIANLQAQDILPRIPERSFSEAGKGRVDTLFLAEGASCGAALTRTDKRLNWTRKNRPTVKTCSILRRARRS